MPRHLPEATAGVPGSGVLLQPALEMAGVAGAALSSGWFGEYKSMHTARIVHDLDLLYRADTFPSLYGLAHGCQVEAVRIACMDLSDVSWAGYVYCVYRSCTASHRGGLGSRRSTAIS